MMIWAIAGVVSIGLMPFLAPMQFIIFVPAIAFFTVSFFNNTKRAWLAELTCLALFAAVLLIHYQAVYFKGVETLVQLKSLKLKEEPDIKLTNKKYWYSAMAWRNIKTINVATP